MSRPNRPRDDATAINQVDVHVRIDGQNVVAGTLYAHRRRGTESATFSYATDYLRSPEAYALDPGLPLVTGAHQTPVGRAMFGAFTDCAPDRWGRTLVNRRETAIARELGRAPRSLGELDYLLGVRDDLRQGALRFRESTVLASESARPFLAEESTGVPTLIDLPALLTLADRAISDTADLPDLQRLVRVGSSLGGARPKAHVIDTNGRIAIAKFPSADHDTWNVMRWEKVALDLAADAGIAVPDSTLIELADRSVLIVDRFDRTPMHERIGYVSAMTALEASDGDERSYLEIAEAIETTSNRVTDDLHQLWRRIVFSILISNTDDHLRNHGFLHHRAGSWRLAPAFDLNPNPAPGTKYLSTAINADDTEARIDTALAVAPDYFRLPDEAARVVAHDVRNSVQGWQRKATAHGLSRKEIAAMAPAFDAVTRPA